MTSTATEYQPLKPGTRLELTLGFGRVETAKVLRWTKTQGPRDALPPGYERVRFDEDGAQLMVFCAGKGVRVISNH